MGDNSRLQNIEENITEIRETLARLAEGQKYTHEQLKSGSKVFDEHEDRIGRVEKTVNTHQTHLAWVKWIGTSVAGALGSLHFWKHS